jgi:hypothetical protein
MSVAAAKTLSRAGADADTQVVDPSCFPWRLLGELLVERGHLSSQQLERGLAEQRRSGRLLGVILVESGYLTGAALARALAEQHGVELRARDSEHSASRSRDGAWRPLGKVLVDHGFLARARLDEALDAQRRRPGVRLGEILVGLEYLAGPDLARALALQQGVELSGDALAREVDVVLAPVSPGQAVYEVHEVVFDPDYRTGSVLCRGVNLLEVSEFALELIQEREPLALEIQRANGETRETVWTYSEARAAAQAVERKHPVDTFGFDPNSW